ncbi:nitroreductase family protein [Candidatus Woesearchaeota archaeon]|nr:nitroreductase family protein [Candidatus Woesearchaeota archaeon]
MELVDAILKRKSIRKYQGKDLPLSLVGELIDAARFAPSSGNTQCWKFIVVKDAAKKKELATASFEQNWMTEAPVLLVVCNDYKRVTNMYGDLGRMFSIQDCAIIVSYIMLLATEKGLGSCWVGAFDSDAVRRILEVPDHVDPEIILALGYSDERKIEEPVRFELPEIVYFDKWNNKVAKELPNKSKVLERIKTLFQK